MKGKIFKIKNAEDELVLPITTTEAVYSEDGKTLNDELDNIENEKATRQEVDVERKRIDNINSSLDKNVPKILPINKNSFDGNEIKSLPINTIIGLGTINLNSTIKYSKDSKYIGMFWSYGGTIIKPTGNFPAFQYDSSVSIDYTRNEFSNFMLDGSNLSENTPVLDIKSTYLTTYEKIKFVNCKLINITESDSLRFIDCRFMDSPDCDININITGATRSVNFIGCNFENYNSKKCIINIDGGTTYNIISTNINFTNCQFERAEIRFNNCTNCVVDGSKLYNTLVVLGEKTNNIKISNMADATSNIIDLGKDNVIERAIAENVSGFNITKNKLKSDLTSNNSYYGVSGTEYLFITTIFPSRYGNVDRGKIGYYKSSGTELYVTGKHDLRTDMTSLGTGARQSFTDMRVLKNDGGSILVSESADSGDNTVAKNVIAKKNLIENGEFLSSTEISSKWQKTSNIALAVENNKLKITVNDDNGWGVYQNIEGLDENKTYMVIMNSDEKCDVYVGNCWNGTQGNRKCRSYFHQLSNGTFISQLYLTNSKSENISIGSLGGDNSKTFNINYIALVEI